MIHASAFITVKLVDNYRRLDLIHSDVCEFHSLDGAGSTLQWEIHVSAVIQIITSLLCSGNWCYLPGFNSDTSHGIMNVNVLYSNVRNTCLRVVPPKASNADSMARTTVNAVYFHIRASSLDRNAVITCESLQRNKTFVSTNKTDALACDTSLSSSVSYMLLLFCGGYVMLER